MLAGPANYVHLPALNLSADAVRLAREGKLEEARVRISTATTMGRKLILAPPRELTTVLTGCKMLRNVLDVAQRIDGISRQELTWLANRQHEIAGLDSIIFDFVNRAIGDGRIDRAAVDRWVSGLMHCTDETAVLINRAIDAWNVLDQELAAKRPTEEAAALGDRP